MQRPISVFLHGIVAIVALLISLSTADAAKPKKANPPKPIPAPGALDGKIFIGALTEFGVNKGREETLEFKTDKFISTHCSHHGFSVFLYECTRRHDGSLRFTADQATAKHGIVHWD